MSRVRKLINSLEERKFDLSSGHLGNGITVFNRAREVSGDYEKIAHIDSKRKVTWYIKNPPKEVQNYVNDIAKGENPDISATQKGQKVFVESKAKELLQKFQRIEENISQDFVDMFNLGMGDREILQNITALIEPIVGFDKAIMRVGKLEKLLKELRRQRKKRVTIQEIDSLIKKMGLK